MPPLPMQYNEAYCRDQLQENDAMFFENMENTGQLLLGDAELNIAWKVSTPDAVPKLRWFLENYTWCKNTAKQRYVENPTVAGNQVLGIWRQTYVRDLRKLENGSDIYYVILTLRQGFIETLVTSSAIDWSEARTDQNRELPAGTCTINPGGTTASDYVIVKWNNVSPYKVDAIIDEIAALDANAFSPTIRGEEYGSNFHRLYTTSNIETDGSATISMLLAVPEFTLTGFQTWATNKQSNVTYHWDVPRSIAQALINAEQGTGKSVVPSYNPTQGLVDIVVYTRDFTTKSLLNVPIAGLCDYDMYMTSYWNVYDPSAYGMPQYVPGITYFRDVSNNEDGAYDVIIRTRKARYRNYPLLQSLESIFTERYDHLQINVTDQIVPSIQDAPRGSIYRQTRNPNEDCSSNFDTSYDIGMYEEIERTRTVSSGVSMDYLRTIRNSMDRIECIPYEPGFIYSKSEDLNDFGLYDTRESVRQSIPAEVYMPFETSGGAGWRRVFRNIPTSTLQAYIASLPTDPQLSIAINDDLTYDGVIGLDPANRRSSVFIADGATWESNQPVYDAKNSAWIIYKQTNYRKFFVSREEAAEAMNGTYNCSADGKPNKVGELWEAVYSSMPQVSLIPA